MEVRRGESPQRLPTTFSELVLQQQKRWRELKKPPLVELPGPLVDAYWKLLINNFPSYIPNELQQSARAQHPRPLIAVAPLTLLREPNDKSGLRVHYITPENPEEYAKYRRGALSLTEWANHTFVVDVMMSIVENHQLVGTYMSLPLALASYNPPDNARADVLRNITDVFTSREELTGFRTALIRMTLSGDTSEVDALLKKHGFRNMTDFTIYLGKDAKLREPAKKNDSDEGSLSLWEKIKEMYGSGLNAGGNASARYPGVLSVGVLASLSRMSNGLRGFPDSVARMLQVGTQSPEQYIFTALVCAVEGLGKRAVVEQSFSTYIMFHEMGHYLTQRFNGVGTVELRYEAGLPNDNSLTT